MHKAIAALLLLQASLTVNANTVTVYGQGVDRETAKKDAFRTAIEQVCGTEVLSNREHFNGDTTRNNVLTYSSCRVENYEILEDQGSRLKIKVQLTSNRISHRLHSKSNQSTFNTNALSAQISSLKDEQKRGDNLIDEVFIDYPYRAFNLNKTKDPYLTSDNYRNLYLMVPYDLRWNYNFITSMMDTFNAMGNDRGRGHIQIMAKDPRNLLFGHQSVYYMNDLHRLDHIKSKFMDQNELRLNVKARDTQGRQVLNVCYNPDYKAGGVFYSIGIDRQLTIFGNDKNIGTMRIKLTFPAEVIYDIYVDVVAARDCKL
jgi:hypothetical protein